MSDSRLAIEGGLPHIEVPQPHADRATFDQEDGRAIAEYLASSRRPASSWSGRSEVLEAYEAELADYFGKKHCVLVNSGTSALLSAFFALDLRHGQELVCPAYTFHATVTPAISLGAQPVLADTDRDSGTIDPDAISVQLGSATGAVVVNHQWGHPCEMARIEALTKDYGIPLIEDVSLAVGARDSSGARAGSRGALAALSLGSTKLLSGGQGGAVLTDDHALLDRISLLGHFSGRARKEVRSPFLRLFGETGLGFNLRIHPLAAVVSRARFRRLDQLIDARKERFGVLTEYLDDLVMLKPPYTAPGVERGAWHGYSARFEGSVPLDVRSRYVQALQAEGLEVRARGYQEPLYTHALFARGRNPGMGAKVLKRYQPADFPGTEEFVGRAVAFPLFLDEPLSLVHAYGEACRKVDRVFVASSP